ncbi:MAG: ACR3 family arsenite efflux transporter, partial [Acidimicrobiales bacterium]|nr:ACR3 family arsenite efflux transporter [Acidimicrobiales bacterium]
AKVKYKRSFDIARDKKLLITSLLLNWVVGPAVMFVLAWVFLPNNPPLRNGLILVGLARCIAMVMIWTELANGDIDLGAVLVAINAFFQVIAYSALAYLYLTLIPGWLNLSKSQVNVSFVSIALNVGIYLGIPLVTGFSTRYFGEKHWGSKIYENKIMPKLGRLSLYGLLFTIFILFALQGKAIISKPSQVGLVAIPLIFYFGIMWFGSYAIGRGMHFSYPKATSLAFSAAGNNFELAIAVAIATFGISSGEALATVVGPLVEVPVLLGLVTVALYWEKKILARES